MQNVHVPVLLNEVFESVSQLKNKGGKIFDGTLGGGGYTQKFLNGGFEVYASDLDENAINLVRTKLNNPEKLTVVNSNFADYIETFDKDFFDGIVLDLGFSSNQLQHSGRGFSYQNREEIFDLRYNITTGKSCFEKLREVKSAENLWTIIYTYSGEKFSKSISINIFNFLKENSGSVLVGEIVDQVTKAVPAKFQKHLNSTLSRVWQALRIWTNDEFGSLEKFLPLAAEKLKPGGRLAIVSFHSLEDKIVTKFMRNLAKPLEIDVFGNKTQAFKLITSKAIVASEKEVEENPRSRSALLRVLEKI